MYNQGVFIQKPGKGKDSKGEVEYRLVAARVCSFLKNIVLDGVITKVEKDQLRESLSNLYSDKNEQGGYTRKQVLVSELIFRVHSLKVVRKYIQKEKEILRKYPRPSIYLRGSFECNPWWFSRPEDQL